MKLLKKWKWLNIDCWGVSVCTHKPKWNGEIWEEVDKGDCYLISNDIFEITTLSKQHGLYKRSGDNWERVK